MEHLIGLLQEYKYFILFPLAIIEGPVLAIVAGFLCSLGQLNPIAVYPIIICGDITGDSLGYYAGRQASAKWLKKIARIFGASSEKVEQIRVLFNANPGKTISLSKIILGIGLAGILLAGHAKVPYGKFVWVCFFTSVFQYIFYLGIGIFFGGAYAKINHYLNYFTSFTIISAAAILLFLFIKSKLKKI